jgi:hypothetical protein
MIMTKYFLAAPSMDLQLGIRVRTVVDIEYGTLTRCFGGVVAVKLINA